MLYRCWPAVEAGTGCLVITQRHRHDGKDHVAHRAHRAAITAALFGTYPRAITTQLSGPLNARHGAHERCRSVQCCVPQKSLLCAGFRGASSLWVAIPHKDRLLSRTVVLHDGETTTWRVLYA